MKYLFIFTEAMRIPKKGLARAVVLSALSDVPLLNLQDEALSVAKKYPTEDLRLVSSFEIGDSILIDSFSCITLVRGSSSQCT